MLKPFFGGTIRNSGHATANGRWLAAESKGAGGGTRTAIKTRKRMNAFSASRIYIKQGRNYGGIHGGNSSTSIKKKVPVALENGDIRWDGTRTNLYPAEFKGPNFWATWVVIQLCRKWKVRLESSFSQGADRQGGQGGSFISTYPQARLLRQ